jgi:hypothetical protein
MNPRSERKTSPPPSVAATAEARLRASSHTALRDVCCNSEHGILVLEGRLTTFFHKQLAQELVANIDGVVQVVNHIEVIGSRRQSLGEGGARDDRSIEAIPIRHDLAANDSPARSGKANQRQREKRMMTTRHEDESAPHLLVIIDHQEAKVYRTELHGAVPQHLVPYDPHGYRKHLHSVNEWTEGKRQPER